MVSRHAATAAAPLVRNHVFDVFRAVSAGLVVLGHSPIVTGRPPDVQHGAVIVDAFFLISGFLLTQQYDRAFTSGAAAIDLLVKRLVRIYPIYCAALVFGFALVVFESRRRLDPANLLGELSASLLVVPAAPTGGASPLFPVNPPCWSLMWEVWLNVVFILAWRWLRGRLLLAIIAVAGLGVTAGVAAHGDLDFGWTWRMLFAGGARATFAFFSGVLLARLYARSTWRPRVPGPVILAAFFPLIFAPVPRQLGPVYELALLFVAAPVLVWAAASSAMPSFTAAGCVFAGDLFYGVYAWHIPILKAIYHLLEATHGRPSLIWGAVAFLVTPLWAYGFNTVDTRVRERLLHVWRDFRAGASDLALRTG